MNIIKKVVFFHGNWNVQFTKIKIPFLLMTSIYNTGWNCDGIYIFFTGYIFLKVKCVMQKSCQTTQNKPNHFNNAAYYSKYQIYFSPSIFKHQCSLFKYISHILYSHALGQKFKCIWLINSNIPPCQYVINIQSMFMDGMLCSVNRKLIARIVKW